jgi:MFS family permease
MSSLSILDREHTVAGRGFNRWLVPPAALCIHLCIGEVYAFSVFNLPLTKLIGVTKAAPGDWSLADVGWIFSVAILFLGLASAFTGAWLDRVGPRKAMTAAALCFGGGFIVTAFGVSLHNLPLVFLGYGVLGGCGLGIGYISPVRTLITWFPDRPGMATGLAIMGFGGGAMIASPLSVLLMRHYASATNLGVAPTFVTLGVIYTVFMLIGAALVRVPPANWLPAGYTHPVTQARLVSSRNVDVSTAVRTPQFYLLWAVLFLNVTAGIGVLSQASPMI